MWWIFSISSIYLTDEDVKKRHLFENRSQHNKSIHLCTVFSITFNTTCFRFTSCGLSKFGSFWNRVRRFKDNATEIDKYRNIIHFVWSMQWQKWNRHYLLPEIQQLQTRHKNWKLRHAIKGFDIYSETFERVKFCCCWFFLETNWIKTSYFLLILHQNNHYDTLMIFQSARTSLINILYIHLYSDFQSEQIQF